MELKMYQTYILSDGYSANAFHKGIPGIQTTNLPLAEEHHWKKKLKKEMHLQGEAPLILILIFTNLKWRSIFFDFTWYTPMKL